MKRLCLVSSPGSFIMTAIVGTMWNVELRQLSNFQNQKFVSTLHCWPVRENLYAWLEECLQISQAAKFKSDLLKSSQDEAQKTLYGRGWGWREQTAVKFCDFVEQYLHTLWSYHFKLEKFSNSGHSFLSSSVDGYLIDSLYKKFTKTVKGTTLFCKVPGHFLWQIPPLVGQFSKVDYLVDIALWRTLKRTRKWFELWYLVHLHEPVTSQHDVYLKCIKRHPNF